MAANAAKAAKQTGTNSKCLAFSARKNAKKKEKRHSFAENRLITQIPGNIHTRNLIIFPRKVSFSAEEDKMKFEPRDEIQALDFFSEFPSADSLNPCVLIAPKKRKNAKETFSRCSRETKRKMSLNGEYFDTPPYVASSNFNRKQQIKYAPCSCSTRSGTLAIGMTGIVS
ncbi:unnamed protein product [Notodromas monacha]|uniref:Uncharacterized protein n=1 Tax=Notodromas monacha TaxID=399045 RepID=A0A7R9BWN6_9CRUS|nr:unnamed protein product [Notodromas monacha]CAG0921779.1 unnamed protein product [Notodromas monacha]